MENYKHYKSHIILLFIRQIMLGKPSNLKIWHGKIMITSHFPGFFELAREWVQQSFRDPDPFHLVALPSFKSSSSQRARAQVGVSSSQACSDTHPIHPDSTGNWDTWTHQLQGKLGYWYSCELAVLCLTFLLDPNSFFSLPQLYESLWLW